MLQLKIRSLIFNILFILWTLFISTFGLPFLFIKNIRFYPCRLWSYITVIMLKYIVNITHTVKGSENIIDGNVIYASKHQSAWETMIFYTLIKQPCYVLKKELLYLPFFNLFLLLLQMIPIDRKASSTALKKIINNTKIRLAENRSVIIFPEGTRANFDSKTKVQAGIVALYEKCNVDVIPVTLNAGKFWSKNGFIKYPGNITIEIFPAIKCGLNKKEFKEILENYLDSYEKNT